MKDWIMAHAQRQQLTENEEVCFLVEQGLHLTEPLDSRQNLYINQGLSLFAQIIDKFNLRQYHDALAHFTQQKVSLGWYAQANL